MNECVFVKLILLLVVAAVLLMMVVLSPFAYSLTQKFTYTHRHSVNYFSSLYQSFDSFCHLYYISIIRIVCVCRNVCTKIMMFEDTHSTHTDFCLFVGREEWRGRISFRFIFNGNELNIKMVDS